MTSGPSCIMSARGFLVYPKSCYECESGTVLTQRGVQRYEPAQEESQCQTTAGLEATALRHSCTHPHEALRLLFGKLQRHYG